MVLKAMVVKLPWIVLLLGLCACASVQEAASPEPQAILANRLAPVELAQGECGLFVWTGDEQKRFILFSEDDTAKARWFDGEREQKLEPLPNAESDLTPDNNQNILFKAADETRVELTLRDAQPIANGIRYKSGVLKHTSEAGWERITPVLGLSACRPT